MAKIEVLVIEDNRLLRDGTTALLNEQKDIRAVSSPGNRSAVTKVKELNPDVVLLDLGPKSRNCLSALRAIRSYHPKSEIVVLDLVPSHADMHEALRDGVSGYVPRNATVDDFLNTIRSAAKGDQTLPPTMTDSLLTLLVKQAIQGGKSDRVIKAVKFTKREQDVINRMAEGKTISGTSIILKIAVFTVKSHIRNILDKLALHTRFDLAAAPAKKSIEDSTALKLKS